MFIRVDHTGSPEALRAMVAEAGAEDGVRSVLVLACGANGLTPGQADDVLRASSLPVFGGVFPHVLHQAEKLERGSVVVGLPWKTRLLTVPGVNDPDTDCETLIDDPTFAHIQGRTALVFLDGLAGGIDPFIDALYAVFGLEVNYVGGGCGTLDLSPVPCVLTPQGLRRDTAMIAVLDTASGVGVSHGWEPIAGPFKVTEAESNRVLTLDWEPAFQVYGRVVAEHTGRELTPENFWDLGKLYPFGMARIGGERIVRDPFAVGADGSLHCVGDVPEGSFVDILHSDAETLIQAAATALAHAQTSFGGEPGKAATLFIDCLSRSLLLEQRYAEELAAVSRPGSPLFGACTLGELANTGKNYLEFYNMTAVVSLLEDA